MFNTHTQAFPDAYLARMDQARELGLAVDRVNNEETVVLIGGDLNAGPYYAHDTWTDEKGNTSDGWWKNAISLPLLQHCAGATDLVVAGRTAAEADDDVELGNATTPPGNNPVYPFTASARSNDLYDRQHGQSEYRARLDHFLGDANGRMKVLSSEMAFTDDIEVAPGVISELSDHYGVRTRLSIAPR